jgi:hypothetical protein
VKRNYMKTFALAVVLGLLVSLLLGCSAVSAQPVTTVKVNGVLPGLLGDMPDIVVLEARVMMDGAVFVSGSGSVHGITCGATFFFEFTDVAIGTSSLTITGTIVRTNNGHQGFYNIWIGSKVQVTANLDGSSMHFMLPQYGIDFSGSGKVVV